MAAPSSSTIAAQAAEWIVRLSCDDAAERVAARRDFDAWKAADRRHAAAAAGMERLLLQVESVRANGAGEPGSAALAAALDARGKRGRLKTYAAAVLLACTLTTPGAAPWNWSRARSWSKSPRTPRGPSWWRPATAACAPWARSSSSAAKTAPRA
jgi:ferric-dicitrate binding protein FerR (iron transport regulator)